MSKIVKASIDKTENINMSINKTIKYNINELNSKYNLLFLEYNKNFNKIKNTIFNKYNYFTGLTVITNIFHITLLKTRNLNLTIFHTQKAIYYFTEFIEQIYDNNNKFLKLTTNEAVIFVYKKTIFEIEDPNNKLSKYSVLKLNILKEITNIYKLLLYKYTDSLETIHNISKNLLSLFCLKKKIKYDIFHKNLTHLYYILVDYVDENDFEHTNEFIYNFFNKLNITNKLLII